MPDQTSIMSVFGMINEASDKDAEKLHYRLLNLPKNGIKVVQTIEQLNIIKETLPPELEALCKEMISTLQKTLIATTSIKGWGLQQLTTSKSRIEINDPRARRQAMGQIFGGGEQGYQ